MANTVNEWEMREAFVEIGRRIWQREYVAANDGNFSVKLSDNEVLCTPTLTSKGFMKPEDMVVITPDGEHIRGHRKMTSEIKMHLEIYRRRPDVKSVIHAHPPNATAFAVAQRPVPKCILPEIEVFIGEIPIARYETPGTQTFAEALVPHLDNHNAFLLTNHGAVTCGPDPFEAYYRMETIEQYCRILILAMSVGEWNQITPGKVRELLNIREKLGYKEPRLHETDYELCSFNGNASSSSSATTVTGNGDLVQEVVKRVMARLNGS